MGLEFEEAIEVFVRAIAELRSWAHPCVAERVEGVWVMRDAPRRKVDYRKEEWIAWHQPAIVVDRIARDHTRGRFFVGAMRTEAEPEAPLLASYKELGYRLLAREAFFVLPVAGRKAVPVALPDAFRIERVTTPEMADRLAKACRSRQILPEHLEDPHSSLRQYVAIGGSGPVGWVRSVTIGQDAWVSNLFVAAAHRRHGIGRALMERMLEGDSAAGIRASVLLASSAGALLYPKLGYEKIGELMILAPSKPG